jgi:diguanylate cyclase (GGDEF)-like protein
LCNQHKEDPLEFTAEIGANVIESNPLSHKLILVVDDDELIRQFITVALRKFGYEVTTAQNGKEALRSLEQTPPDLMISDVNMPEMDGLALLREIRSKEDTSFLPVILLTTNDCTEDIVDGLNLGADDYLTKPFKAEELIARVQSKIMRPPVPAGVLMQDRQTGLMSERNFINETSKEISRSLRGGKSGVVAYLSINEIMRVRDRYGFKAERGIAKQISGLILKDARTLEIAGRNENGLFMILLPETSIEDAKKYLTDLSQSISRYVFEIMGETLRLTPVIGYVCYKNEKDFSEVNLKAKIALDYANSQIDLVPKEYNAQAQAYVDKKKQMESEERVKQKSKSTSSGFKTFWQILITIFLSFVLPFGVYFLLDMVGVDISKIVYYIVVVALVFTALMIWIEGLLALKRKDPPENPAIVYPPASAIIAAYLPNEAATIIETIEQFLRLEYPGRLQIILAYNTPQTLPVEKVLQTMAAGDPRLQLLKVQGSESKSQNVNAAISEVTGEFVGIFDADHLPQIDAFTRAWKWLSSGADIVQGHCQVRNGSASWVSEMVAVEFEAIYAVSHPGRTRLYGFGIFGGSNGYWKTDLLRETRMHGYMLTEDIDSSMRVTEAGHIIATDPYLVSRELAPGSIKALWNQRMRWAQGWFQVSMDHFMDALRSKKLTVRQKIGTLYLLVWREIYPWISGQILPIVLFWIIKYGGADKLNWLIPIFVLTSLFTLSVGPGQTFLAYRLAAPEIKQHKGWFWGYLWRASLFYTEFKNTIARVAQIKQMMGEKSWRITPRSDK